MLKDVRATLAVWLAVVAVVLGLRALAILQPLELMAYDLLLSSLPRPAEVSDRISLLEISEADIQELGRWPLTDLQVAELLESILGAGASAVGLDIYRDLPIAPGEKRLAELLAREPRLVLVFKHGAPVVGGVRGHTALEGTGQLGFSDLLLDPDGRVRRALLYLERDDGGSDSSFPLQLGLRVLAREGITPQADPVRPEWLRLGPTSIPFLESGEGGYVAIDDRGYQMLVDFQQSEGGFESVPFDAALDGQLPPGSLAGKVVLVGSSADSLNDFSLLPAGVRSGGLAELGETGVWIHAAILDQILRIGLGEARPLRFVSNRTEVLCVIGAAVLGFLLAVLVGRLTGFSTLALGAGVVVGVGLLGAGAYGALSAGVWVPVVAPAFAWVGTAIAQTAWISGSERAQRAELMEVFSQVQSPRVAEELWRRRDEYLVDGQFAPETAIVTVLFLDMKGYTASAEKMPPQQLLSWINDFMAPMARMIEAHGGYPDDYFGDGIKADFGVSVLCRTDEEIEQAARNAFRCSLGMVSELARINRGYSRAGLPTVALRVGIHTGPVVVGLLGSKNKGKYTVVGETVVTAQRLEATDRVEHDFGHTPCRVLLSEETHALLGEQGDVGRCQFVGSIVLKGKSAPVGVYALDTEGV